MLHKRFKPAKCKTSLKLATSRIKLMKNKKGVQINQMKRDLAQLLETGQDRTARIRVEHVIREEKMVAAYDLIEIYCELIVARLPILESQKTCPVDLKEAVTSVIFAAPRCSDISELSDIRKQFKAKYGKEFVSAAIELRPDSGVSRMLVEKLSAVAPDLQTKIKVLSAVAKQHDIEWDPTSLEEKESKPPSDLLNGPGSSEQASMTNADPPKLQASSIDGVHSREEKKDPPFDFAQQNRKYTMGTQNIASTDTDTRSSGITSENMEIRQPFPREDEDDFSSGRENWNMEFKDATSAAQAAAESAERAAMAARAAAQFSSQEKIAKQYPTESHVSNFKEEGPHASVPSGSIGENHSKDSYETLSDDRKPKILNQQMGRSEHDISQKASHGDDTRSGRPTSSRSNNDSIEDEKLVNSFPMADRHFEESLHEDQECPPSSEKTTIEAFQESKSEVESGQKIFQSEDINYFAEEATNRQPSLRSSHSSTSGDEFDAPDHQKFIKKSVVGNPFAVIDQGNIFRESTATSSIVDAPRDDDEAILDDDGGPRFDTGFEYDEVEAKSFFGSPGRESPTHVWSPRTNKSNTVGQSSSQSHLFSERFSFGEHSVKSVEPSETDDHIPASFDHSDGPDSESESELAKSSFSGKKEIITNPELPFQESSQNFNSRKSRIELDDLIEKESTFYDPNYEEKRLQSQQSSKLLLGEHEMKKHNVDQESYDTLEDNDYVQNQSDDLDTRKELTFGTLTGGLRNKGGLRYPPYTKSAETNSPYMSKDSIEKSSITGGRTSLQSSSDSRVRKMEDKRRSVSMSSSDSDSDDDKFPVQSSEKASKQDNTISRFSPAAFFNDEGTDSDEEVLKQAPSRVRLGSGLSRRTRGSPSVPYSKSRVDPEPKTVISSSCEDRKPSRYSYLNEIPVEPQFKEDAKQGPESHSFIPSRKATEIGPSKRSSNPETKQETVETMPERKIPNYKPTPRNTAESGNSKTADLGSERLSGENVVKKPINVHPKLPEFEEDAKQIPESRPFNPSRKVAGIGSSEAQRKPNKPSAYSYEPSSQHKTKQEAVETMPEPKIPTRKPTPRNSAGSGKTKTSSLESSGENLVKKPSHVHPKLPEYDSLAARLQSLRTDHQ